MISFAIAFIIAGAATWAGNLAAWSALVPLSSGILLIKKIQFLLYVLSWSLLPLSTLWLASSILRFRPRLGEWRQSEALPGELSPRFALGALLLLGVVFVLGHRMPWESRWEPLLDGLCLTETQEFLGGKRLYKELFIQYGPLWEIGLPLLARWGVDNTLAGFCWLQHLIEPCGEVFVMGLLLLSTRRGWVPILFAVGLLGGWHLLFFVRYAFPMLALCLVVLGWRTKNRLWHGLAGVATALAYFYSSESGVFTALTALSTYGIGLVFSQRSSRHECGADLRWFLGGLACLGLPFCLALIGTGSFAAHIENVHLVWTTTTEFGGLKTPSAQKALHGLLGAPLSLFSLNFSAIRWWLPNFMALITLAYTLTRYRGRPWREWDRPLVLLSLAAGIFFLVSLGRSDYEHWLKGVAPAWVLLGILIDRLVPALIEHRSSGSPQRVIERGMLGGALALAMTAAWSRVSIELLVEKVQEATHWRGYHASYPSAIPRLGPMQLSDAQQREVEAIVQRIQRYSQPHEKVYFLHDESVYYYLAERPCATRYAFDAAILTPAMTAYALADLKENPPVLVMSKEGPWTWLHQPVQKPLVEWLENNYRRVDSVGGFSFWIPMHRPGPL